MGEGQQLCQKWKKSKKLFKSYGVNRNLWPAAAAVYEPVQKYKVTPCIPGDLIRSNIDQISTHKSPQKHSLYEQIIRVSIVNNLGKINHAEMVEYIKCEINKDCMALVESYMTWIIWKFPRSSSKSMATISKISSPVALDSLPYDYNDL